MQSTLDKINKCLWSLFDETSRKQDPYVRIVALDTSEAKNSSVWFKFKDGSGCLKRHYAREGVHIPLVSEIGGFIVSALTFTHHLSSHWKTHYVYLFDNKSKCLLGLAMSSAYEYNLRELLRNIERDLFEVEEEQEKEYYENEEYEDEEEIESR